VTQYYERRASWRQKRSGRAAAGMKIKKGMALNNAGEMARIMARAAYQGMTTGWQGVTARVCCAS